MLREHMGTLLGESYALLGFHHPAETLAHEFVQAVESMPLRHPAGNGIAGAPYNREETWNRGLNIGRRHA